MQTDTGALLFEARIDIKVALRGWFVLDRVRSPDPRDLQTVCIMRNGSAIADILDDDAEIEGDSLCSSFVQSGWTAIVGCLHLRGHLTRATSPVPSGARFDPLASDGLPLA